jgi:hypothetical protein
MPRVWGRIAAAGALALLRNAAWPISAAGLQMQRPPQASTSLRALPEADDSFEALESGSVVLDRRLLGSRT